MGPYQILDGLCCHFTELGEDGKRAGGGRGVYIQWHFGQFNFWIIITMNQLRESLHQGRGPGQEFRRRGQP